MGILPQQVDEMENWQLAAALRLDQPRASDHPEHAGMVNGQGLPSTPTAPQDDLIARRVAAAERGEPFTVDDVDAVPFVPPPAFGRAMGMTAMGDE